MPGQGRHDLTKCTFCINGFVVNGFADGDVISFAHDTDETDTVEGADGFLAMSTRPSTRLGTASLDLSQASLANNVIQAILAKPGPVAITFFNALSGENAVMPKARCKKRPDMAYARGAKNRKWTFAGLLTLTFAGAEE